MRALVLDCDGSSPRVRGKPRPRRPRVVPARLIPACAGKTIGGRSGVDGPGAHPRACGENSSAPSPPASALGSSPRVRGKLVHARQLRTDRGLIPARAGKTPPGRATARARPAHPRACGENRWWSCSMHSFTGSSPRVRGKPRRVAQAVVRARLIPARAGKTPCVEAAPGLPRAHPRACGENDRRSAS